MKKSYYSLLALLAAGSGAELAAQKQDSTLVREMTIEKEYTPIVRDADKITRMPEVETPQTNKTKIEYAEPSLKATTKREVHTLEVGSVNTEYPFSSKNGYLTLGGGNYMTLKGDFGYHILDTEKDVLRIDLHHLSSNGKIKFVDESWGKTRRKINDDNINLYYHHNFDNLQLKTNFGYDFSRFNYYGRGEWATAEDALAPHTTDADYTVVYPMQTTNRYHLGFEMNTLHKEEWDYHLGFGFTGFSMKNPGIIENEIEVSMGLGKHGHGNWDFHTELEVKALVYGGESDKYDWETDDVFKNEGMVRLAPSFKYKNGSNFTAKLGVNADFAFAVGPYIGIAPDVHFDWHMADHWALYGALTGGIEQYSMSHMMKEYRYYYNLHQHRNTYDIADLKVGIQSNALAGFWFDIYGGLGYTLNETFLISEVQGVQIEDKVYWQNTLNAHTADAFSWVVGAKMKYEFSHLIDIHFDLQHNGWKVEHDGIASYKPKWEVGTGVTLRPLKKLTFDLDYDLKACREASMRNTNISHLPLSHDTPVAESAVKVDDIHQLNLTANYRFCKAFSVNAALNNLMFRRQAVYYGMPDPGFNFVIGGTLRF